GTVTVTVTAVNDAPVASSSSVTLAATNEGSSGISTNSAAVQLNGSGAYMATTISPLSNVSNFTISFWLKPDRLTGQQSLVAQNDAIEVSLANKNMYVWTTNTGGYYFDLSSVLSVGTWVHLALTGDATSDQIKVYANGAQVGSSWSHSNVVNYGDYYSTPSVLVAGGYAGDGMGGPLGGTLDEISVWTVTKSASEISTLRTQPPGGSEAGLVGYWGLNEGTGTTAFNGKTGAASGSNLSFKGSPGPTWTTSNLPATSTGSTISALFGSAFSDATDTVASGSSANSLAGIAITAHTADATKGRWQYKTNGTNTWINIPDVSVDSAAFVLAAADSIGFLPFGDYNGPAPSFSAALIDSSTSVTSAATLDVSVRGGTTPYSSSLVTANTSVSPVNDAPVLSGTPTNPTVVETDGTNTTAGTGAATLIGSASLEDLDFAAASLGGGYISVTLNQYVAGDILDIPTGVTNAANAVQLSGTNVQLGDGTSWTTIATVDGTSNGQAVALKLNLNSTATEANIGYVLQAIRFRSTSDNPTVNNTKATRAYTVLVNDGANNNLAGGSALDSNTLTGTITITQANDLPVADLNGATAGINNTITWTETANANSTAVAICANATLTDIDNTNLSQITLTITGVVDGNSEVLSISGVSFLLGTNYSSTAAGSYSVSYSTSTGVLTILPASGSTFTLANAQTLLRGITYNSTTHNPTTTPNRVISITVTDAGDNNSGGANATTSLVATSTISLTAVNDTPSVTAVTMAYTDTVGDDTFNSTTGTLTASDAETSRSDLRFTLTGSSAASYTSGGITYDRSKAGTYGSFYLESATGNYLYVPNDAAIEALFVSATDTFAVTTTDNNSPTPATSASAAVTVNITGVDDTNQIALGTLNNFIEQTSVVIAPNATITAPRDGLTQLRVSIDNNKAGDTLSATVGSTGISASFNATTGVLTLTKAAGASDADFQQVLRTVTFSNISDAPDISTRSFTVSSGSIVPYFSHTDGYVRYYEYVNSGSITWGAARDAAAARTYNGLSGYLATITSQNENDFIQAKVGSDAWIGGSDDYSTINAIPSRSGYTQTTYANQAASEGRWTWVTGPEAGSIFSIVSTVQSGMYANWNSGEPNNSG
ncbi:MAG: beta strand repeat-containing protein, partial [Gemmataceae bacterium]